MTTKSAERYHMHDLGRDLISAIMALAAEVERGMLVSQGFAAGDNIENDRERAIQRCREAIASVQKSGGKIGALRGDISAAMRRLEGMLARERRISKAPRVCGTA